MKHRLEQVTMAVIGAGVVMLMQPLSLTLYSWSFVTILVGTVSFMITAKLPG